jgi:hypothetical protein
MGSRARTEDAREVFGQRTARPLAIDVRSPRRATSPSSARNASYMSTA